MVPSKMANRGHNHPCPYGNGNNYKKCCQPKDEVAERDGLAVAQAQHDVHAAKRRLQVAEFKAAIAAKFAGSEQTVAEDDDDLYDASNSVLDLISDGNLDEAEAPSCALLPRYPEAHGGSHRLGLVNEQCGDNHAADCCRILEFLARTRTTPTTT